MWLFLGRDVFHEQGVVRDFDTTDNSLKMF